MNWEIVWPFLVFALIVFGGMLYVLWRIFGRFFARSNSWRDEPPTVKQIQFADDLGIEYPDDISKGELSDLITERTGR